MNRITGYNGVVHIGMLPKTILGKWSASLAAAFIIALAVFIVLVEIPTDFNGPSAGFNPVVLIILETVVVGTSVAAFITGLISMIKDKERSVLVILGIIITFWLGVIGAIGQFLI